MGLFDGFEAGWNSFKNNELKTASNVLFAPNPIIKAISNPKKAIEDPGSTLPIEIGSNGPVVKDAGETWKETGEDAASTLLAPNPIISAVTGNTEDIIPGGKPAEEKWNNVTEPLVHKAEDLTNTVKDTVKDTVNNVTKGLGDALPILAIGGAAVLVISLLLGRR